MKIKNLRKLKDLELVDLASIEEEYCNLNDEIYEFDSKLRLQ